MRVEKLIFIKEGENSVGFTRDFARKVYDHCALYQHRDFEEFFFSMSMVIRNTPRYEYVVKDDDDNVLASMAFYRGFDFQIGQDILMVMLAYSDDTKLLAPGYRWMFKTAKVLGLPFVSYTKEVKDFEYRDVFKRIK